LRSHLFQILDGALLRLRSEKGCGLVLNRNLPFLEGHSDHIKKCILRFMTAFSPSDLKMSSKNIYPPDFMSTVEDLVLEWLSE
jgi:hypothetical protein